MAAENPVVFFDITIGGSLKGRIEMELRADVVPKTAEVRFSKLMAVASKGYLAQKLSNIYWAIYLSFLELSVLVHRGERNGPVSTVENYDLLETFGFVATKLTDMCRHERTINKARESFFISKDLHSIVLFLK